MEGIENRDRNSKLSLGHQTRDDQILEDQEEANKKGGWVTFPFIIGNLAGLSVASGGWGANWIVFLIKKFNIGSITATKINNVGFGFINLFPIAGAIIADSFSGNFAVVAVSSFIALLGMIMLTLIAGIDSLRPSPCSDTNTSCESASVFQYLLLYTAMGLSCIGIGGSRFTVATMGADQFNEGSVHQATYFNWYFIVLYIGNAFSFLGLVYLEDNVGWGLGFGLCALSVAIALAVFLIGKPFYRSVKLKGSPFVSMARVVVAAIRKRNAISSEGYYFGEDCGPRKIMGLKSPSKSFGLLNSAALKTENDRQPDGSYRQKSWTLCSVQEVEDLKKVIKILPLWSTGILLSSTIAIFNSLTTVQALTMDRNLGSIEISAGTFLVFSLVATAVSILFIDRAILPAWQILRRGRGLTLLQRIGTGHVLNVVAMMGSALIESRRLSIAREADPATAPMSAFWLVGTLTIVGFGEAFQFPGQIALYYREFPKALRSTSTAMISLLIGLGYYLSAAFTDFVNGITGWMPNDINHGRLDNVYWLCTVIGLVNFGYYLVCAWYYEYQHDQSSNEDGGDDGARSS